MEIEGEAKIRWTKKVSNITKSIRGLSDAPYKCPTVESMLGIANPYYFLHADNYYIFYKVEKEAVLISDIYSEREDFMEKLFGIKLRMPEGQNYWGE
ncbi:MAG: type II toxin-antitoxin system RelE/ParE family toxin [Lachnospiraceae bacterium]|nr:type II toxin-antitoxin system RelE/ParE family toxin [Lachnospiraceae bacterium]